MCHCVKCLVFEFLEFETTAVTPGPAIYRGQRPLPPKTARPVEKDPKAVQSPSYLFGMKASRIAGPGVPAAVAATQPFSRTSELTTVLRHRCPSAGNSSL